MSNSFYERGEQKPVRSRHLRSSALFVGLVFVAACLAPWIAPYGLGGLEEKQMLQTPSASHWMGTDGLGRDLFTRVLYGARVSLAVGLGTAFISLLFGTTYGLLAGFKGGNWDHLMMRIVDIFYGLPDMLIFILLSLLFGRNIGGLLIALGLVVLGALRAHRPRPGIADQRIICLSKARAH